MNYLLDTHVLLWALISPNVIPDFTQKEIQSPKNNIYISAVSFWEISIKLSLGKLSIEPFNTEIILETCKKQGFEFLDLDAIDALNSSDLQIFESHKDSFDRMLIYQCLKRDFTFISKDEKIKKYESLGLKLLWR